MNFGGQRAWCGDQPVFLSHSGKEGKGQSQRRDRGNEWPAHAVTSPLLEKRSVHSEAQHGAHRGTEARSQPEGGVLQVRLSHVPERGRTRQRAGEEEKRAEKSAERSSQRNFVSTLWDELP